MISELDRTAWRAHPRFARQALLVESHDAFLAYARSFRGRIAALEHGRGLSPRQRVRLVQKLPTLFDEWQRSMMCHERYEENKLYPYLTGRFELSTAALTRDHEDLHQLATGCLAVLGGLVVHEEVANLGFSRVYAAFDGYAEELAQHLQDEEAMVIPHLLELTPDEFDRYGATRAEELRALLIDASLEAD